MRRTAEVYTVSITIMAMAVCAVSLCACTAAPGGRTEAPTTQLLQNLEESVRRCAEDISEAGLEACHDAVKRGLLETGMAFPDSELFYERVTQVLVSEGKWDAAVAAYREGISRYQQNSRLYYGLGLLLVERYAAYAEALGPVSEAVRWDARFKEAFLLLGEIQNRLRRVEESMASYHRALEIEPANVDALVGVGQSLSGQRRWQEALDPLSKAVRISPAHGVALFIFGEALMKVGRPGDAIEPLARAAETMDDPREAYCLLSFAFTEIGRDEEAQRACALANTPRPGHRDTPACPCQSS